MEILFCDRCHESIPDAELESGRAVRVGGRLLHVACALARSTPGPARFLTFLLAVLGVAGAAWAIVRLERMRVPDRSDDAVLAAQWRADVEKAASRVAATASKDAKAAAAEVTALRTELSRARDEIAQGQRAALDRAVATLDGKVDAYVEANLRRFEANEKQIQEIAGWVKEVRDLAARSAAATPREAPPAHPEPPTPAPAPAPSPAPAGPGPAPGLDPEAQRRHDAEVDLWITRLKDPDSGVSFSATYKLKELKDLRAVPALVDTLKTQRDYYTRLGAATALGELRACDAVPALIEALEDKEELVQTAAGEALTGITGRDARIMVGLTKKERRQLKEEWSRWWKENETAVRQRLGQAAPPR